MVLSDRKPSVALLITLVLLIDLFSPLSFAEKPDYGGKEQKEKSLSTTSSQNKSQAIQAPPLARTVTTVQAPLRDYNTFGVIPGRSNPVSGKTPPTPVQVVQPCVAQRNCPVIPRQEVRKPVPPITTIECKIASDCGDGGFIGRTFSVAGKAYQKFRKYYCMDADTTISQCIYRDQNVEIIYMDGNVVKQFSEKSKAGVTAMNKSTAFFSSQQMPLLEWGQETQVTNNSAQSFSYNNSLYPKAAVGTDGDPFVVWEGTVYPSDKPFIANDIYFQKSINHGNTWSDKVKLSTSGRAGQPAIAVSGSIIHVVWKEETNGTGKILYAKSLSGGMGWAQPVVISSTSNQGVSGPDVAASQDDVYVVWSELRQKANGARWLDVYLKKSGDGGQSWMPDVQVSVSQGGHDPKIGVSGSKIHVVWLGYSSHDDARYRGSSDKGVNWGEEKIISESIARPLQPVVVADTQGGVFVGWLDSRNSQFERIYDVYLNRSLDNGSTWMQETRVSFGELNDYDEAPALAVNSLGLYVLWAQRPEETLSGLATDIFYSKSSDRGTSWISPAPLTGSNDKSYPSIAANDVAAHAVWQTGNRASIVNQVFHRGFSPKPCNSKADCGSDGFLGGKICENNTVTQVYRQYSCLSGLCYSTDETKNLQSCGRGCYDQTQCACMPGHVCIDQKTLGYTEPSCKVSPVTACEASCINGACTCNDSLRCAGNDLLHTKTDCTSEIIACEAGCSNSKCLCREKSWCEGQTLKHKDSACNVTATVCENGCDPLANQCNPVCSAGWFCKDEYAKGFMERSCAITNVTPCRDGCRNGECIVKPHCDIGWSCADSRTAGYRNEDCTWDYAEACGSTEVCRDGYCYDNSPPPACNSENICSDDYHSAYRGSNCAISNESYCPDGCSNGVCVTPRKCSIPDGSSRSCSCYGDSDCPGGYACQSRAGFNACVPRPNNPAQAVNPLGSKGYCSPEHQCGSGDGDCDTDQDCRAGLVCSQNVGAKYGLQSDVDICENKASQSTVKQVNLDDYYSQGGVLAVAAPYLISNNGYTIYADFHTDSLNGASCVAPEIRTQPVPHFNLTIYKEAVPKNIKVYNLHLMNVKNRDGRVCPHVWESVSGFCDDFCGRKNDDLIRNPPSKIPYPKGILSSDIEKIISDFKLGASVASILPVVEMGALAGLTSVLIVTLYIAQKAVRCAPVPGNIALLSCPFG